MELYFNLKPKEKSKKNAICKIQKIETSTKKDVYLCICIHGIWRIEKTIACLLSVHSFVMLFKNIYI